VCVARSRHNNAVERSRAPAHREWSSGLTRLGSIFEGAWDEGPQASAVSTGLEPRRWGGPWGPCGGVAPLAAGRCASDGHTRGLEPSGGRVATRQTRAGRETTGARRGAPVRVGAWHACRPAGPAHRRARVDPRGGLGPRPRWPAAWVQERWAGARRRAPPGRVAGGAGGAEGWDATAPRRGRGGTLGATPAAASAGCTRGRATAWCATAGPGRPGRDRTPGPDRGSGAGRGSARSGGESGPGRAGLSRCLAQPGCRRAPPPVVQTPSGRLRSGRSWRTSSSTRPRKRGARAGTGTRAAVRAGHPAVRSAETPPAGPRPWTGGWSVRGRVQGWRRHQTPSRPPTSGGSRARVMGAWAAARRHRSSRACGGRRTRAWRAGGRVKTTGTEGPGRRACRRAARHPSGSCGWHGGPRRWRPAWAASGA
jgi:hypothetical protein